MTMYSDLENVQQKKQISSEESSGEFDQANPNQMSFHPPALQLKCASCGAEEDDVQAKFAPSQFKVGQLQSMEEEEETASLKKNPSQFKVGQLQGLEEEEEAISMKKDPSQLKVGQLQGMEEEEETASLKKDPSQFKMSPIQRATPENSSNPEDGLKNHMSQTLGHDFSGVNIETDSQKTADMGALAMAQGKTISFAPGQFSPETSSGRELAGHEFKHIEQQDKGRVTANTEVNGMPVNDDKGLEKEADDAGKIAAQTKLKEI